MKIYLSATKQLYDLFKKEDMDFSHFIKEEKPYILESFFYVDNFTKTTIQLCGDFILDSGAFTFQSSVKGKEINWEKYVEKYAEYINENEIENFFELDIDYVIGYEKVKKYRRLLEDLTGKKVIPVWHKVRGVDEFRKMCDEYNYIAIGASGRNEDSKWIRKNPMALRKLVQIAHASGCKIHGLGYTDMKMLPLMGFDSVDSSTWLCANRYGEFHKFDGKTIKKDRTKKGKRLVNSNQMDINNFKEWVKFQKYMEREL